VTVDPAVGGPSRDEIVRQLRRLFPRLYEVRWTEAERQDEAERPAFTPRASFTSTVRDYLLRELEGDPDREALLALAEGFLREEGEA
jgi:hypothetical protein